MLCAGRTDFFELGACVHTHVYGAVPYVVNMCYIYFILFFAYMRLLPRYHLFLFVSLPQTWVISLHRFERICNTLWYYISLE
jgi:hypothetical protein